MALSLKGSNPFLCATIPSFRYDDFIIYLKARAPDGENLDAYVLGVFEPIQEFIGKCIAVIHRRDDKLIVVPVNVCYSDEQLLALTEFQERFFKSDIIRG